MHIQLKYTVFVVKINYIYLVFSIFSKTLQYIYICTYTHVCMCVYLLTVFFFFFVIVLTTSIKKMKHYSLTRIMMNYYIIIHCIIINALRTITVRLVNKYNCFSSTCIMENHNLLANLNQIWFQPDRIHFDRLNWSFDR